MSRLFYRAPFHWRHHLYVEFSILTLHITVLGSWLLSLHDQWNPNFPNPRLALHFSTSPPKAATASFHMLTTLVFSFSHFSSLVVFLPFIPAQSWKRFAIIFNPEFLGIFSGRSFQFISQPYCQNRNLLNFNCLSVHLTTQMGLQVSWESSLNGYKHGLQSTGWLGSKLVSATYQLWNIGYLISVSPVYPSRNNDNIGICCYED